MKKLYLVRIKIDSMTELIEKFRTLNEAKAYAASYKQTTFIEAL